MKESFTVETPPNSFSKLLRRTALITLAAVWLYTFWLYPQLPDVIPTHFDLKGRPDDYGRKTTLFLLPVIATVLFALLRFIKPVRKWPLTSIRDQQATDLFSILSMLINLLFLFILFLSYQTIRGKTKGLGEWFLPVTLAVFLFPTLYFLVRSLRNKTKP